MIAARPPTRLSEMEGFYGSHTLKKMNNIQTLNVQEFIHVYSTLQLFLDMSKLISEDKKIYHKQCFEMVPVSNGLPEPPSVMS
jgi:hypothetical protein